MDYLTLKAIVESERPNLIKQKVHGFWQLSDQDVVLSVSRNNRFLISIDTLRPGFYPLTHQYDHGTSTKSFSEMLNNRLKGAIITDILFLKPGERVLMTIFSPGWPASQKENITLIHEIMGRHSNLILVDGSNRIMGTLKIVPSSKSSVRPVVPGEIWTPPPSRKGTPIDNITAKALTGLGPILDKRTLFDNITGLSPWTAEQLIAKASSPDAKGISDAVKTLLDTSPEPEGYVTLSGGKEYLSIFKPLPLSDEDQIQEYGTISIAAWNWHERKPVTPSHLVNGTPVMRKALDSRLAALIKTQSQLRDEESRCSSFERIRRHGEAILANFGQIKKGQTRVTIPDPYDPEKLLDIGLDPSISPNENAQSLFEKAKRMERGLKECATRKLQVEKELEVLKAAFEEYKNGNTEPAEQLLDKSTAAGISVDKKPRAYRGPGRKYTRDGFTILVGKNSTDNEKVTFKAAGPHDLWMHTRDYAGSHVVIITEKREVPDDVIRYAAHLASKSSQAKGDPTIDVMVTERKWVKKLKGGKPGQVTVEKYRTVRPLKQE